MTGYCIPSRVVYTAQRQRRSSIDKIYVDPVTVGAVIKLDNAIALAQQKDRRRMEQWLANHCKNPLGETIRQARYRANRRNLRRIKRETEEAIAYYSQFGIDTVRNQYISLEFCEQIAAAIELMLYDVLWKTTDPAPEPEIEPTPEPTPSQEQDRRYRVVAEEPAPPPVRVLDWRPYTPPPRPQPQAQPQPEPEPEPLDVLEQVRSVLNDMPEPDREIVHVADVNG